MNAGGAQVLSRINQSIYLSIKLFLIFSWISDSPSLSVSQIGVSSVGRHYLSSVFFACLWYHGGILGGSHVHITLLPHVQQQRLLCVQIKGGCHFHCLLLWVMFSSELLAPFDSTLPDSPAFQLVFVVSCPSYPLRIQPYDDSVSFLSLFHWFSLTKAAASDVW